MITHLVFEPEPGYLRVIIRGEYPSKSRRDVLSAVHAKMTELSYARVLADCRGLDAPKTEMDRFNLGVAIAEMVADRYRIAVVSKPEQINRFMENAAVNRGARLVVTSDEKDAIAWLVEQEG